MNVAASVGLFTRGYRVIFFHLNNRSFCCKVVQTEVAAELNETQVLC